ncbi:uncharacterized protein LOC126161331 isoform X2 [Schistocerca cancellata]|uniref:uncharacterized protein LOC126161331 isoform X2 n=1 Tax=Schistocerca cancellata TaxID=274614 RepID=UPI002117C893|nr:uncharacterized protein LOC126161331 isoform X2 [Schistocerca cancellata]
MMSLYRTLKGGGTKRSSKSSSCGPAPHNEMVSRRKILSRSRDDLNLDSTFAVQEEEEDVWYQRDKLYKDHIQEVLDKWTQIDDEIWAKVIVLERNRRVAKAYARAPVLTVNGSDDGFDGFRIGLCGFDNPMRDAKTEEVKRHIGQGVKVKMDDQGNILVKRVSKSNVYVKSTAGSPDEETSIGNDVLKLPGCALEMEKPVKLFDMKKFQQNVSRELRRAYPDRRRLECQCLSAVAFVKNEAELLDCPIWVLVVNVVAMDMLKSKLPPVKRPVDIRNRPRIPIPDEDPYSVAGSGGSSGGSSGGGAGGVGGGPGGVVAAARDQLIQQQQASRRDRPPKLPPRDTAYPQDIPKPDYDDVDEDNRLKPFPSSRSSGRDKAKDSKKYDDPYYCGLRARVPKFVTSRVPPPKEAAPPPPPSVVGRFAAFPPQAHVQAQQALYHQHHHNHHPHHGHHPPPTMWHARSFDSGMGVYALVKAAAATTLRR